MDAAQKIARQRKSQNWLAIGFTLAICVIILQGVFYAIARRYDDAMAIFDLQSGAILVGPVVNPMTSTEVIETQALWCVQAIYNRSPVGFDAAPMIPLLFDPDTNRKLTDEFKAAKPEYAAKQLRSKIEVMHYGEQDMGDGSIHETVVCQQLLFGQDEANQPLQQVKDITVILTLARNPHLSHRNRFPLMCFGYKETDTPKVAQNQ